ncbi:MAG: ribose-phosphate diphosphokinase [Treponema sp.]|jgi:ribose-phosphate pyrophosphokinase|nr:ribose-phosphate diphosphokinase [Treponema sp.]
MNHDFIITATRSMRTYAARVVDRFYQFPGSAADPERLNGIGCLTVERFADGEMEVVVKDSIRGRDAVLFAGCSRNEAGIGVEEAKIELYHTIDAMKRAKANAVILFEPYVSCSRSDRAARRSSVGLWVHLKTAASLGASHYITYQLHSDKSKSLLDPAQCAIDDVPALTLLKKHLCDAYVQDLETLEQAVRPHWAFCSVDAGGEKLARDFANSFSAPLVVAHKQRNYAAANRVESVNILTAEPLEGKVLWIVDDMVDTGASIVTLINSLQERRPAEINILAVHAVLSSPAAERLARLVQENLLNRFIVTDSICCPQSLLREVPNLEVVSSTGLSAAIINALAANASMSGLFQPFNAAEYLRGRRSPGPPVASPLVPAILG